MNAFVHLVDIILEDLKERRSEKRQDAREKDARISKALEGPLESLSTILPMWFQRRLLSQEKVDHDAIKAFFLGLNAEDFDVLMNHFGVRLVPIVPIVHKWVQDDVAPSVREKEQKEPIRSNDGPAAWTAENASPPWAVP